MGEHYAKSRPGILGIIIISILSIALTASIVLSVFMFIPPAIETIKCSTVEEVENIEGYDQIVESIKYLSKRADIDNIKSISFIRIFILEDYQLYLRVEYENSYGTETKYISSHKYSEKKYDSFYNRYKTYEYNDIEFVEAHIYESHKDDAFGISSSLSKIKASMEKKLNDFAVKTIWEKVNNGDY